MESNETLVVKEILFFIQNKIHVAPKNVIVDICAKFFHQDEITAAIPIFESTFKIRLSLRQKSDDLPAKLLSDVYVKLWSLDAGATQIPRVLVADFSRIPQENSNSLAPMEQLLATVHCLKTELKHVQSNMELAENWQPRSLIRQRQQKRNKAWKKNVNAGIVTFKGVDLTVGRYVGHTELGTETDNIRQLLVPLLLVQNCPFLLVPSLALIIVLLTLYYGLWHKFLLN